MKNIASKLLIILFTLYSCEDPNKPPEIQSVSVNPSIIDPNGIGNLTCIAIDEDGDDLTFTWTSQWGSFPNGASGNTVQWQAPIIPDFCTIFVTVNDGDDNDRATINVLVEPTALPEIEEPPEIDLVDIPPPPTVPQSIPIIPAIPESPVVETFADIIPFLVTEAISHDDVEEGYLLDSIFSAIDSVVTALEDTATDALNTIETVIEDFGGGNLYDSVTVEIFIDSLETVIVKTGELPQELQTANIDTLLRRVEEVPVLNSLLARIIEVIPEGGGKIQTKTNLSAKHKLFNTAGYEDCIHLCEDNWEICASDLDTLLDNYQQCVDIINVYFTTCSTDVYSYFNACVDIFNVQYNQCINIVNDYYSDCYTDAEDSLSMCLNKINDNLVNNLAKAQWIVNEMIALADELNVAGPPLNIYAPILQNLALILFFDMVRTDQIVYNMGLHACTLYNDENIQICEDFNDEETQFCEDFLVGINYVCEAYLDQEYQECVEYRFRVLQSCDDYLEGIDTQVCEDFYTRCVQDCNESYGR